MKTKLIFLAMLLNCSLAFSASFKCSEVKTRVESLICMNEYVSSMDETMSSLYSSLVKNYSDARAVKQWQKNWLNKRNACEDAKCLNDLYRRRVADLELALAANSTTRKWTGSYTRYINGKKDTDSADLLLIALDNSKVIVEGTSIWVGNVKTGNVNMGEMQGVGVLNGSILQEAVTDGLCSANLILTINNTLAVVGESGCGGMNVTFNGEYLRN